MRLSSLQQVAWGALLANQSLAKLLHETLLKRPGLTPLDSWDALREECRQIIVHTMIERWPRRFRANEVERSAALLCGAGLFQSPELPCLDEVDALLLERHGDYLHYRPREAQLYAALAGELDPLLIAGWHLARWLGGHRATQAHDVSRIIRAQLAMLTPPDHLHRPMADNHVHLGGTAGDDAVMVGLFLASHCREEALRPLRQCVYLMLQRLQGTWQVGTVRPSEASWFEQLAAIASVHAPDPYLDWAGLAEATVPEQAAWGGWLLQGLALAMQDGRHSEAALWWWLALWTYYRSSQASPSDRVAVLMLVNGIMAARRTLIVDKPGIRYFTQEYYRPALRAAGLHNKRVATREGLRRVLPGSADKAELKIAPSAFNAAFVHDLVDHWADWARPLRDLRLPLGELQDTQREAMRARQYELERWHFCLHFARSQPKRLRKAGTEGERNVASRVALRKRQEVWREAEQLNIRLQRDTGWTGSPLFRMAESLGQCFVPGRWVRGLDVAGDESAWSIEYFAGPLRWLRRGLLPRSAHEPASSGFHLSIHAGEDYSHPVSGMRHVDETVLFCEMRDGDRLGHALALGIPPDQWMERHGEVLIPVDEHLDNLVWTWHYAAELASQLPLAAQALPRLQLRIGRFLPHVGWAKEAIQASGARVAPASVHESLWKAWRLRRNCPWQLSRPEPASAAYLAGVPDHAELLNVQQCLDLQGDRRQLDLALRLYLGRCEVEVLGPLNAALEARQEAAAGRERLVRVSVAAASAMRSPPTSQDGALLYDQEDEQDMELMRALQDHLLDRYAAQGLCIEANPTSNLYIARLSCLAEHPIFRWSPPDSKLLEPGAKWNKFGLRRGAMPVIVNTDDPGIMPTTLRMEFELLREAAMDLGEPRHEVEAWLERLRQAGLDHFDRHHLPIFSSPA